MKKIQKLQEVFPKTIIWPQIREEHTVLEEVVHGVRRLKNCVLDKVDGVRESF